MLAIFHKMEIAKKLKKCKECGTCCNLLSRETSQVSLLNTVTVSQIVKLIIGMYNYTI